MAAKHSARPFGQIKYISKYSLQDDRTRLPLQSSFEEGDRNGTVVSIQDHIHDREEPKSVLAGTQELVGNDAIPQRVERSRGKLGVACIGSKVEVVERQLLWVPE